MFENNQPNNQNGNLEKDINLLPEKMRSKTPPRPVSSGPEQPRYTNPVGSNNPVTYQQLSWWQKLIGKLKGGSNANLSSPVSRGQNQTTPLQKLYAQTTRPDQGSKPVYPTNPPANPSVDISPTTQVTPSPKPPSNNFPSSQPPSTDKPLSMLEKIDQQLQKGLHLGEDINQNDDQYGVNLIPSDMVSEVNERKILFTLLYTVIISAVILAGGYITIQFIQLQEAKKIQKLQQDIQQAENEFIAKSDDLKALINYQQTYDNISLLLDSHIYWDKLFSFLEQNVADDVYFLNVTADRNGTVSMSLVAKSYEALANQYLIFKQAPEVVSINISNAVLSEDAQASQAPGALSLLEPLSDLSTQASSTASSTASTYADLRAMILDYYETMPVSSQVSLVLDTNIFYRDK